MTSNSQGIREFMTLKDRVALITGAGGALGSYVAHSLAAQGASLALLDHGSQKLAKLVQSLHLPADRLYHQTVDLMDLEQTLDAAGKISTHFGRLDILLHLVGGWTGNKTLVEVTSDELAFMVNRHIWTSFNAVKGFIPYLVQNGWGRVIMITSPYAGSPKAKGGPYAIGKAGQEALLTALSHELEGTGVTANALQVKTIDVHAGINTSLPPQQASGTTLPEIASAVLYLCSDSAGSINGAKIPLFRSST